MSALASIESLRFRQAVAFVLGWETVFDRRGNPVTENDPDDPGGLTKFGIDQRSHPHIDIRALTRSQAEAIYHRDYWLPVRAHELPVPVGEVLFDIAVNNGKSRAARWLQEALGVEQDGFIGPITLKAACAVNPVELAQRLVARRERFYRSIARGGKAKFLKGWLNRNGALRKLAAAGLACLAMALSGCASIRDAWTADQLDRELNRPIDLGAFEPAD
jgi:lysozyme family protein